MSTRETVPSTCENCKHSDTSRRNGDKIRCKRYSLWKRPDESCCFYMLKHNFPSLLQAALHTEQVSKISMNTGTLCPYIDEMHELNPLNLPIEAAGDQDGYWEKSNPYISGGGEHGGGKVDKDCNGYLRR